MKSKMTVDFETSDFDISAEVTAALTEHMRKSIDHNILYGKIPVLTVPTMGNAVIFGDWESVYGKDREKKLKILTEIGT